MPALRLRSLLQRRFAWLLWLALLLPIAQVVATTHVLAHAAQDASDAAEGKLALHPAAHCDLCATAAAVSGGAPLAEAPTLLHPAAHHAAPRTAFADSGIASPRHAYRSRAPPLVLH